MSKNKRRRGAFLSIAALLAVLGGIGIYLYHRAVSQRDLIPIILKGKAPVAVAAPAILLPHPRVITLPNGLRVFVVEDHRLPYVQCLLSLPAGSLRETKPATSDLAADMLLEGTQTQSEAQIAAEKDASGLALWASNQPDETVLHGTALPEDMPQLVTLMADVLLHPAFPPDRLFRLQYRKCANLEHERDDSRFVTNQVSGRLFYGGTPYAQTAPSLSEINSVTSADLLAFHQRCFVPQGAILGIYGDVSAAAITQEFQRALASWKPVPAAPELPALRLGPPPTIPIHLVNWQYADDTILSFQVRTAARANPDYPALVVADRILGGVSSSRLFGTLREAKGLTYSASSTLNAERWPGIWQSNVVVRQEDTDMAVGAVSKELRRLANQPVSPAELAGAKRGLIGAFALDSERPEMAMAREMVILQNNLPADYWDIYLQKIQAVTATDVQHVAGKYLGSHVQVIAVGARDKIKPVLQNYGAVEDLNSEGKP